MTVLKFNPSEFIRLSIHSNHRSHCAYQTEKFESFYIACEILSVYMSMLLPWKKGYTCFKKFSKESLKYPNTLKLDTW